MLPSRAANGRAALGTPNSLARSHHDAGHRAVSNAPNDGGRWRIHTYARRVSRLDRITSSPEICFGKPTIRGLRYPVESILALLAGGMSVEEVLADYEDLRRDDVLAAVEFGLAK